MKYKTLFSAWIVLGVLWLVTAAVDFINGDTSMAFADRCKWCITHNWKN